MAYHNFIVCDFETGGFDPCKNPILEGAFVVIHGVTLKQLEVYEDFVLPYGDDYEVQQDALDITGISLKEVKEKGVALKTFVDKLILLFKKYKVGKYSKPRIVAQNAAFELKFLNHIFDRCSYNLFDYIDPIPECTQKLSIMKWPNAAVHKLPNICDRIGIEHIDAHRAMKDTLVTVDVFKYFVAQFTQNTEVQLSQGQKSIRKDFKFQIGE